MVEKFQSGDIFCVVTSVVLHVQDNSKREIKNENRKTSLKDV